jgi:hypothetical protein
VWEEGNMPEKLAASVDDPFRGRPQTSHERMTGLPWDASYQYGPAPWDIGRPQAAIARLASTGVFAGTVLDARFYEHGASAWLVKISRV